MENTFVIPIYIDNKETEVTVKKTLSFVDRLSFVQSVVFGVVDEDTSNVAYAWKDYFVQKNFIEYFTDIQFPSDDINERYDFILKNDIYQIIQLSEGFDSVYYDELIESVDEQLEFEVQKIHNSLKVESVKMLEAFNAVLSQFEELGKIFSKTDINKVTNQVSAFMKNVDLNNPEHIKALIKANEQSDKKTRPYNKKDKNKNQGNVVPMIKGQTALNLEGNNNDSNDTSK